MIFLNVLYYYVLLLMTPKVYATDPFKEYNKEIIEQVINIYRIK